MGVSKYVRKKLGAKAAKALDNIPDSTLIIAKKRALKQLEADYKLISGMNLEEFREYTKKKFTGSGE